jgi:uncharacterized protein YndB with AHSA1/START domain
MMLVVETNGPTWLRLAWDVGDVAPEHILRWFVEPPLIAQWWAAGATVEPRAGGPWVMAFPQVGKCLRGEIAEISPTSLHVSWAWDDEPDLPARSLVIRAEPVDGGTRLGIVQGPYRQGDIFTREDEDRQSHLDGWRYFLPRLVAAMDS